MTATPATLALSEFTAAALFLRLECGDQPRQSRWERQLDFATLQAVRRHEVLPLNALGPEGGSTGVGCTALFVLALESHYRDVR